MNAALRRGIAYIAGRRVSGKDSGSVYDFADSRYYSFSGSVSANEANVYDFERSQFLGGSGESLYDFGAGQFISLKIEGTRFDGYDFASNTFYSGTVGGSSVSIYDHEFSEYYSYSV